MENLVIKEIELRRQGKKGELGNLSDIDLYSLAYKLGITEIPQSKN